MWHKRLMEDDKFLPNDINPHASAVKYMYYEGKTRTIVINTMLNFLKLSPWSCISWICLWSTYYVKHVFGTVLDRNRPPREMAW